MCLPQGRTLAKAAIGVIVITFLSKILGFGREMAVAAQLGATSEGDAYKVAIFVPMMIFSVISSALSNTFIPLLAEQETKGPKVVQRYISNVTITLSLLFIVVAGLSLFFNPWIVKAIAPGFDNSTYQLTVRLTYWLTPSIIFLGFIGLNFGYLHFRQVFVLPGLSGFIFNFINIAALLIWVPRIGVFGAVAGMLAAYCGQMVFLAVLAWLKGYRVSFYLNWHDPALKKMMLLAMPMIVGTATGVMANWVDRIFASALAPGSISALDFATRLNDFALGIFVSTIGGVYFPTLSRLSATGEWEEFKRHLLRVISLVIYMVLPMALGMMLLAEPIVQLIFQRGAFDLRATNMTANALFYYTIGLCGFAIQVIFSQTFYALRNTLIPVLSAVIMVLINIVLNYFLVKFMGLGGIAFSTSIASIIMIFFMPWKLKQKVPRLCYSPLKIVILKGLLAVLIMALGVKGCDLVLGMLVIGKLGLLVRVSVDISLGAILYLLSLKILRVPEVEVMVSWINEKAGFLKSK